MTMQRDDIDVECSEGVFSAYLSVPSRPNGTAIVVLQEIFGVNANMRAIADVFAEAGHAAIAPDLYWRREKGVQLDPETEDGRSRAMELMKSLDREQAVADGSTALAALRERVWGQERSAAVGYCFGGGVAYLMAARGAVDGGVAYYGTGLHTMLGELEALQGRLLLHIAADDHLCPPEAQQAIGAAVARVGDRADAVVHPGVGHAFARAGGSSFDEAAAARANAMTMELIRTLSAST